MISTTLLYHSQWRQSVNVGAHGDGMYEKEGQDHGQSKGN